MGTVAALIIVLLVGTGTGLAQGSSSPVDLSVVSRCRLSEALEKAVLTTLLDSPRCNAHAYLYGSLPFTGFVGLYPSPSPSPSSIPTTSPSALDSASAAPNYAVETGNWWLHLPRAEKLKVVEGAIDGLINGWWRAYTDYDTKVNFILIDAMKSSKDWLSFDKALAKVESEVKPTVPTYSKHLGYYIDAIDKFYATYPKATAKVTVGEALQCLSDKPWESCAKVAKIFSH